tara:strand:- start:16 stop:672 length:657 start_codon:yes stop_codon:yes gene_type:complete
MSWSALAWASKQKTGNGTNKLVLIALANYADDNNSCFPSYKTLIILTELSQRTIARSLKQLEENSFITIKQRFSEYEQSARQTSNFYQLNINVQFNLTPSHIDHPPSHIDHPPIVRVTSHITNHNKPNYNSEFELFWKTYPNRPNDNKYGAFQKFVDIIKKKEIAFEGLIEKTKWFAKTQEGKDTKFIPHCKTWLSQKRFLDVEKPTIKKTNLNMLVG